MTNNTNLHCIYVAKPTLNNFITGLNNGVWGFKNLNDSAEQIKSGDYLIFAHALQGPVRSRFSGQLTQYVLAKVTSDIFTVKEAQDEDNPQIWDDEDGKNIYPHRFYFKLIAAYPTLKHKNNSYELKKDYFTVTDDPLVEKIYEAFRHSSCIQGRNGLITDVILKMTDETIKDNSLKNLGDIFDLSKSIFHRNSDKKIFDNFAPPSPSQPIIEASDQEIEEELDEIHQSKILSETEKKLLVQSRLGQGQFRKDLLKNFKSTCVLTGIRHESLLLASHIKAWKDCTNEERLDTRNGLLLSALMDKLFDRYFITFDPDTLRLIMVEDPLIREIIINHQLLDFVIKTPFKKQSLVKFKEYMAHHYHKFHEINEKRYAKK
ncbi:TPA: HNH endonuclease [Acinetobacter baumannii]|uniref:HNH endonuclease n=1 Tax=Acinetobacter baumannii TaxID=470 RepID=UPI001ECF4590|nr:HNH endonuclease [Acinetobacter baumannii]EHU3345976.1 HNH endonuclease [Acinetobacter baumannii]MDC4300212.1 HNH endonuclease [Acinetobacter baumannii]MDC4754177.1 HNH endonuclease [Acinetobacter baumannii]MDC5127043.1 HNH endonuclease [Acinetobacter baumannii]MDC5370286.1 HNH endonuclease [Acinetobacter baumannii]